MYPVTETWKTETNAYLRNPSYIKIIFGVTDPDAPGLSHPMDNNHLPYSDTDSVDVGTTAVNTYQTLERNRFILDGENPLALEVNPLYQGYVSSVISGDSGEFEEPPYIRITFDDYVQFPALTFQFDESTGDYPNSLQIVGKKDGTLVFDKTYTPNSPYWESTDHIPICNELIIYWLNTNIPHRRARLLSLIYGIINNLTSKDIVSCSSEKEIDLLTSKIPKQNFEFTMIDTERKYDPENPSGVWEYLESRQPVTYQYGYELSDGSIEWIPWGLSYSTGDVEVSKQNVVSEVTVKCAGLADHLTTVYDEGKYYSDGRSLFDLAMDVMKFAGFENTVNIDNELKNIYTHNPLPSKKVSECLQLIANAGRCIMSHSRGGYIEILREKKTTSDFSIDFNKMTDTPTTSKIPPLRYLTIGYNVPSIEEETSDAVSNMEISNASGEEQTFTHQSYTNQSVTVSEGLTIVGTPKYYAYKTVVALSGSGKITITGNRISMNTAEIKKKYSDVGEDLSSVSNDLIDNAEDAKEYMNWVASVNMRRNTYSAPDRGYPEVDIGDSITVTSNFTNNVPATIVQQKLTFNGAISGEGKYIIGGDG